MLSQFRKLALAIDILLSPHVVAAQRPSTGCGKTTDTRLQPGEPSREFTIESHAGGGQRHFHLHMPASYPANEPAPLILVFHGKSQNASEIEAQTQLSSPDFNSNAIVVYPQGIKNQWTGDPEAPPLHEINDVEFANDLLQHVENNYCIDLDRIYATGFSNGGGLVGLLACSVQLSQKIAAFAAASGAFYKDSALREPLFSNCDPRRSPVPIMEFHGSKDPIIHYDGKTTPDGHTYSLPEWLQDWAGRNGCEGSEDQNSTSALYDGGVERSAWTCHGRKDVVVHYYIHGFGHGWPTTTPLDNDFQRYGPTYFNATPIVMDFFEKHPMLPLGDFATVRDEL